MLVSERGIRGDKIGTDYHQAAGWTDIIAISKSYFTLLGLKRDGTVVIAGAVGKGQEEVADWTDIVAVAAGDDVHIGLKSDGTLALAGEKEEWWEDAATIKDLYVPTIELGE